MTPPPTTRTAADERAEFLDRCTRRQQTGQHGPPSYPCYQRGERCIQCVADQAGEELASLRAAPAPERLTELRAAIDRLIVRVVDGQAMFYRFDVEVAIAHAFQAAAPSPRPEPPVQQESDHRPSEFEAATFDGVNIGPQPDLPRPSGDEPGRIPSAPAPVSAAPAPILLAPGYTSHDANGYKAELGPCVCDDCERLRMIPIKLGPLDPPSGSPLSPVSEEASEPARMVVLTETVQAVAPPRRAEPDPLDLLLEWRGKALYGGPVGSTYYECASEMSAALERQHDKAADDEVSRSPEPSDAELDAMPSQPVSEAEHTRAILRATLKGFQAGERHAASSPAAPLRSAPLHMSPRQLHEFLDSPMSRAAVTFWLEGQKAEVEAALAALRVNEAWQRQQNEWDELGRTRRWLIGKLAALAPPEGTR